MDVTGMDTNEVPVTIGRNPLDDDRPNEECGVLGISTPHAGFAWRCPHLTADRRIALNTSWM